MMMMIRTSCRSVLEASARTCRTFATKKRPPPKLQKDKTKKKQPKLPKLPRQHIPLQAQQQQQLEAPEQVVPSLYLYPTASPFAFVAACAVKEYNMDADSFFEECMSSSSSFSPRPRQEAHYLSPKEFGYELPTWNVPEVAVLGRSNVGKSSLLNAATGHKHLARISKQPGRTQQVNYFGLYNNNSGSSSLDLPTGCLVDLPGYGFAKAPDDKVDDWQANTQEFLLQRQEASTLQRVYLLVDSRRGTIQMDRNIMGWFDEANLPYTIVLTKSDRVSKPQLIRCVNDICMRYHSQLYGGMTDDDDDEDDGHYGSQGPVVLVTSAKSGHGILELMASIDADFGAYRQDQYERQRGHGGGGGGGHDHVVDRESSEEEDE